ncbi:Retrovirus-related Pol polyprotein from transposon 297,Retrovirus-related Pol polyprotein from transposon 17.6 [Mytilus coruscus]|uniref:Retrovirus-related Pol polyprotein from transposon 297,Retrovirus-related Pol polyprotein from transposon 17.6 n=1 Tax=Mytilus coruscus TaxID=42192 RepID=A0A6J8CHZ6_MYTCO|nr:Retrovirus-related Pol polyprotein from transposon 297,Retrovirus-related Pol polyprotein from transposon 17.6 [Mytilus coruscus]
MIVSGESNEPIFRGLAGLIEPNVKFMEKNGLLVARSIVHPEVYNIPLRIININNEPCTLYKGTIIATRNKVNEEDIQTSEFVNNVAGGQATLNKGRQLPDYLHEVFESSQVNLDKDQSEKFKDLLMEYSNIFSKSSEDIGLTDLVEHTIINTGNHPPVRQRPRRIPLARMKDAEAEIQKMVQQDIIEPSTSPWNSNIVLVKKSDDSWRFCIDFHSVNLLVLRPSYPLPRIDDTIDSLSGSKFFSTVDLKSGYYQIPVAKEDRPKTAFSFPGGGLWQFKKNAHGSIESGIATDPNKIQSVKDWPVPKNIKDVRSFQGLTSYYRKFILKYADKAKPLYKVTEKNQKFVWTDDCQQSFEELKNTLISAPILAYPTKEDLFILDTDASNVGMGAVLSQLQDGVEKVICYFSKTFSRSERKYCVTRRELLAIVASIKHFHHYLYGQHFKVRSDHGALSWLFNFKNPEGQLALWFEVLASYDFKIEHRAGWSHNNVDALSRRPCYNKECPHCARAEINYELVPTHKDSFTVENCNDSVTVSESCRNVQDVSAELSVTKPSISCINEDRRPNMTSDETCHKVKSHVIHNKFNSKGPERNPDVLPVHSKIVRVCTRSKDYGCSQNEKDNPVKEINFENVSESQLSDDVISIIIQWKLDEVKPTWADVSHMSSEVKFYWSRLNSLILVNGILYRKWETYNGKHYDLDLHIVRPANFKRFVLNQVHNTVTGGHLGVRKTLSKIKQRYFWYKMRQDVKFWCTKCDICASKKAPCKKPKAPMKQYLVGAPWERMAIDILGPLPCSVNDNRYLMVVQDYFSEWTEAIPIPDTEAVTVAKKFVERIVTIFGVPLSIHSDQGSNFESHVFKEMCNILGIHKTRTTPFRPKSDGKVEKSNSTIETMLSAFVSKHQRDWDEYIYLLMLAYRSSKHESLGTSPCSMLFGREVNLPVDLILGRPETEKSPLYLKTVYAYALSQKLEVIHQFARNKLKLSSDRMKRNYDVGTKMQKFDAGDPVWLHNPRRVKGLCPKLQKNWEGPFIVVNKLNDVIYRIQKGPKTKPKVVHQDRLKPYLGENVPVWFNEIPGACGTEEDVEHST